METLQQEKKLKVRPSNFQTELSFNEWAQKYNVSSAYVQPTPLFQGNPSCGIKPIKVESPIETFFKNVFKF